MERIISIFKETFELSFMIPLEVDRSTNASTRRSSRGRKPLFLSLSVLHLLEVSNSVPNVYSYHNFSMQLSTPGIGLLHQYYESYEIEFNIFKLGILCENINGMPELQINPELNLPLYQWYLYENFRQHPK